MAGLFKSTKTRILLAGTATAATLGGTAVAFADPKASDIVGRVLGIVCSVFRYIGILLFAWSIGMFFLALKNEDSDSKSRASMMIVVSIALIGLKSLLEDILGTDFGISITDKGLD